MAHQVYEQSYLTWRDGPQMIGFSLAHNHRILFILGMASYFGSCGWLAISVLAHAVLRYSANRVSLAHICSTAALLLLDGIPTGTWQKGMFFFFGPGR
jgi:hypothetical protein